MKMAVQNAYYECAGRHFDDVINQSIRGSQGDELVLIVAYAPKVDLR